MKFAQIAIGSILLIEGILLLYSPEERYNFHTFAQFIKSQFEECACLKSLCFTGIQKLRFVLVAVILSGGFSLTFANNIYVGIIAQFLWTVTQSQLYYSQDLSDVRNSLVQFLFFIILLCELGSEWKECKKKSQQQKKKKQVSEQQNQVQQAVSVVLETKSQSQRTKKSQQKQGKKQEKKEEKKQEKKQVKKQVKKQQKKPEKKQEKKPQTIKQSVKKQESKKSK